ncbi:MAG: hypothetical protein H0W49_10935 [Nitrospirales bacterium]|nr:hypothetical protein [Nitrospirales bacterium]MBA3966364.1 hypothetical protein [Nitrospirales bacterium]
MTRPAWTEQCSVNRGGTTYMTIMLIVFGGAMVLAICLAILNWYYWGRSTKERYHAKHTPLSEKTN